MLMHEKTCVIPIFKKRLESLSLGLPLAQLFACSVNICTKFACAYNVADHEMILTLVMLNSFMFYTFPIFILLTCAGQHSIPVVSLFSIRVENSFDPDHMAWYEAN